MGSAIFHYLGPSFAVLLFARVPVPGVAWMRIVAAALVFGLWRLPRATYALFVALLPATAVVIGLIVLTQVPFPVEVAGVTLVIAGVAVHRESKGRSGIQQFRLIHRISLM